jgi:hypothetical protein
MPGVTRAIDELPTSVLVHVLDCIAGILLVCPGTFNLVVVEGCPKSLKRYHKLMLRRIDWNATPLPQPGEDDEDAVDGAVAGVGAEDKPPNSCHLVWEVSLIGPHHVLLHSKHMNMCGLSNSVCKSPTCTICQT